MQQTLWRRVLLLALPVALQALLQSLLGMADVAMVAGLGPEAVAAVGLAAKLHFLLMVLMFGVGSACGVLVAQYAGAGDRDGARRIMIQALLMGGLLTLPGVVAFAYASPWLVLMNPDPAVVALSARFLLITALALLLVQAIVVLESALRSVGDTVPPLLTGAFAVAVNIALNYILIFGHLGFPALGVEGAAWATLTARLLQLLAILGWLYGKRHIFALRRQHWAGAWQPSALRYFAMFTAPLVLNHAIWGTGNAAYHIATGFAGTEALAVMGFMVPIESAFFALFVGMSNASAVMVGQALGADEHERAWDTQKFFNRLTLTLVLLLGLVLWLARHPIVALFMPPGSEVSALLLDVIGVFCLGVWLKVLNMVRILGVLRAGGDTRFVLVTDSIVTWGFGLPIYLLAVWLGLPFIVLYALTYLEDALKFFPVKVRVNRRVWMRNLTRKG